MIAQDMVQTAVKQLYGIPHVLFNPVLLTIDLQVLTQSFPESEDFSNAIANTCANLVKLTTRSSFHGTPLTRELAPLMSLHYQHIIRDGQKADMRLIYAPDNNNDIRVLTFGHRYNPTDIYTRLLHNMTQK